MQNNIINFTVILVSRVTEIFGEMAIKTRVIYFHGYLLMVT